MICSCRDVYNEEIHYFMLVEEINVRSALKTNKGKKFDESNVKLIHFINDKIEIINYESSTVKDKKISVIQPLTSKALIRACNEYKRFYEWTYHKNINNSYDFIYYCVNGEKESKLSKSHIALPIAGTLILVGALFHSYSLCKKKDK
jgi:hypothetical protein